MNDTAHPTDASETVYDDTMLALFRLASGGVFAVCVLYGLYQCGRCVLKRFNVSSESAPPAYVYTPSAPPAYVHTPSAPPMPEKEPLTPV